MESEAEFELVIIGAGLHGLSMDKTYLQVNPASNILLVDKSQSVGGSWAKERLYPGLKTNNVFGTYEFGDFPMVPERYGAKPGAHGHIPGEVVHAYFCHVAAHYKIASHIRCQAIAESAVLQEDGKWRVQMFSVADHHMTSPYPIIANKLVIATGLTSEPFVPTFPGGDSFKGLILHSKQLKKESTNLASCKNVVVLGGNKSAWDVCYRAAMSGSQVHMVIRPSGGGPSYLWPRSFSIGPFTFSLSSISGSRLFTLFDPTPFGSTGPFSSLRSFLHGSALGNMICSIFWTALDSKIRSLHGFGADTPRKKLEPWITPFWMGNSLSVHNYETNWFDLVHDGRICVHIADVISLSEDHIRLSGGEYVMAEALVCCTGWKSEPAIKIHSVGITTDDEDPKDSSATVMNTVKAKAEIYNDIPYLRDLPRRTPNAPSFQTKLPRTPSNLQQLYRFVVPWQPSALQQRNLAFIGAHSSPHAVVVAQVQALWITTFLLGKVEHLKPSNIDLDAVRYDTILHSVYGQIRRPKESGGAGGRYPDLVFDSIPYVDALLADLGLEQRRKRSWWREYFEMYRPVDYHGIVQEWIKKEQKQESEERHIDDAIYMR